MTKKEFINVILTRINGGSFGIDVFKKVHPKILSTYIELALNDAMFNIFKMKPNNYDSYSTWFTDVEVEPYIMGIYRSNYPTPLLQNVSKANSIRRIVPTEDWESVIFLPSTPTEAAQIQRLGTATRNGVVSYVTQIDYITYYNMNKNIVKVNILAFKPVSEYNMEDELPLPAGASSYVLDFVYKYALNEVPIKNITDSNPEM